MSRRAHLTWRLVAILALVVAAIWPRNHARHPAPVELTAASMDLAQR